MTDSAWPRNHEGSGSSPLLTASGVRKAFTRGVWPRRHVHPVLSQVNLRLAPGEVVGLVGENGSGKTTLMRILVGDLRPDDGTVHREGLLGYCPQVPQLYDRLTCREHLDLFAAAYGMNATASARAQAELLNTLDFERYANTRAGELSGGTAAKLNLALALLADPPTLFLDEPYASFDWDTYLRFWSIVADRRQSGRGVLVISHFAVDRDRFDRIIELRDGVARST